jgi:hypothetical protein
MDTDLIGSMLPRWGPAEQCPYKCFARHLLASLIAAEGFVDYLLQRHVFFYG